MRSAGLDIGSRTVELVVLEDGEVVQSLRVDTTPQVETDCARLLASARFDRLVATGYGRALAEVRFGAESVTEIKAHARGACAVFPGCRGILDIGGQDTKAIALDGQGRVLRFEMNDRCAAGAGKFLEMMSRSLAYPLEEFGEGALGGEGNLCLNSMCAVFAESEVVGLMTRGEKREEIALAVHRSIVQRSVAMLRRVSCEPHLVFAGGCARNVCLVKLLEEAFGQPLMLPEDPQMIGALGAALIAAERAQTA